MMLEQARQSLSMNGNKSPWYHSPCTPSRCGRARLIPCSSAGFPIGTFCTICKVVAHHWQHVLSELRDVCLVQSLNVLLCMGPVGCCQNQKVEKLFEK